MSISKTVYCEIVNYALLNLTVCQTSNTSSKNIRERRRKETLATSLLISKLHIVCSPRWKKFLNNPLIVSSLERADTLFPYHPNLA